MRIIAEIPHDACKISIFYMNQKYIIKIEKYGLEQSYKISEIDYAVKDVEDIKKIITEAFIQSSLQRFYEMQKDLDIALADY